MRSSDKNSGVTDEEILCRAVLPVVWFACFATLFREVTGTSSLFYIGSYNVTTAEPILIAFANSMRSLIKYWPQKLDIRSYLLFGFCTIIGINFIRGCMIDMHAALFSLRSLLPLVAFLTITAFIPNKDFIVSRILTAIKATVVLLSILVVLRTIFGFSLFLITPFTEGSQPDVRPLTSMGAFLLSAGCALSLSGFLTAKTPWARVKPCALLILLLVVLTLSGQRTAMIAGLCGMVTVFALELGKTRRLRILSLAYAAFAACFILQMDKADLDNWVPSYFHNLAEQGQGTHAWRREVWDGLLLQFSGRWSTFDRAIGLPAGIIPTIYLPGMPQEVRYWRNIIHSMYFGCLPIVGFIGAVLYVLFLAINLCIALWKSVVTSTHEALTPATAAALTVLAAVYGYSYELLNEAGLVLTLAGLVGRSTMPVASTPWRSWRVASQRTQSGGSAQSVSSFTVGGGAMAVVALTMLTSSEVSAAETRKPLQDLISAIERGASKSVSADELIIDLEPVVYEAITPLLIDTAFTAIPENRSVRIRGVPGKTWIVGSKIYLARPVRADETLPTGLKNDERLRVIDADDDLKRAWRQQLNRTSGKPGTSEVEIFQGGRRLEPARWPDKGYARSEIVASDDPSRGAFAVPPEKAAEWATLKGLKVGGYITQDWFYETNSVVGIDQAANTLAVAPLQSGYKIRPGLRYFVFNSAVDLDSDGEYLIDRDAGRVFIRGHANNDQSQQYEVAISAKALIIRARKNLHFEGVSFGKTRSDAVQIEYSEDVSISNCRVEGTGGSGIVVRGGRRAVIDQCILRDLGESGVVLSGGTRQTLIPGDHAIRRSTITDASIRTRTYMPAVDLDGVGNTVESCYIGDLPHVAISFSGNDHRIENNELTRVVSETSDAGAIYSGRDLTWRGTTIRGNFFHDIMPLSENGMQHDGEASLMDINGVYLDDLLSGILVQQNIFLRVRNPVYIGGGRDNLVVENIFIEPRKAAIGLDDRGLQNWDKWSDISNPASEIRNKLRAVPTSSPLFAARYPELVNILDEEPGAPRGNLFASNIVLSGSLSRFSGGAAKYAINRQNVELPQTGSSFDGLEDIKHLLETNTSPPIGNNTKQGLIDQIDKLKKIKIEIYNLQQRLQ